MKQSSINIFFTLIISIICIFTVIIFFTHGEKGAPDILCDNLEASVKVTTQDLDILGNTVCTGSITTGSLSTKGNLEASVKVTTQDLDILGNTVCTGSITTGSLSTKGNLAVSSPGLLTAANIACTGLNSIFQTINGLVQTSTQPIILRQPYTYFSGSFPVGPDYATQFVNGIIIIANGTIGNYITPSSISIDAYIQNACNVVPFDGMTFIFTVLNRNYTTMNELAPIDGLYGIQSIPQPTGTSGAISTQFFFYRVGGIWLCLNN